MFLQNCPNLFFFFFTYIQISTLKMSMIIDVLSITFLSKYYIIGLTVRLRLTGTTKMETVSKQV